MPRSDWAREPQLLSLRVWSLCSATREATIVRGPRTTVKSGPRSPQLEKALAKKRRPSAAKKKKKKKNLYYIGYTSKCVGANSCFKKLNPEHNNEGSKNPIMKRVGFPGQRKWRQRSAATSHATPCRRRQVTPPRSPLTPLGTSPSQSAPRASQPRRVMTYCIWAAVPVGLAGKDWHGKDLVSADLLVKLF